MLAPLPGTLQISQLFGSTRGGAAESYSMTHDGTIYHCLGHAGIDMLADPGTPVLAMKSGTVFVAPNDPWHGAYTELLGLYAVVVLPTGETHTYGHLSSLGCGNEDPVTAGQMLALTGASGTALPNHLHVAVRPIHVDYGNFFDGTIEWLTHLDQTIHALIDLSRV